MPKLYDGEERPYVVTASGHRDYLAAELCVCKPRMEGWKIVCPECGTVYGTIKDLDATFNRQTRRWR